MRKILWCCAAAAGAAVCGAFWAAGYVSQNPDSSLGRYALAVCPTPVPPAVPGRPAAPGTAAADDLVPDDPVPVDDPPPVPTPGSHVPPEVMAALGTPPPIVIHDEEDLNASANPTHAETVVAKHVDAEGVRPAVEDVGVEVRPTSAPPVMPRCADDDNPAPRMPYCADEPEDGHKTGAAAYREFDACAFWMGFFSAPTHLFGDDAHGRCQEDAHYPQQYSGVPYTGEEDAQAIQPAAAHATPLPSLPESEQPGEPPAPKEEKQQADPSKLFDHPHRLKLAQPSEPRSDTMEMRPSDWRPYSLDPGPF